MRIAVAVAFLVATMASSSFVRAAADVPENHGCMGRWVGLGRNTGYTTDWTIDLTMTASPSGGRCGTIEYTNPVCGGTLEDCSVVDGEIHTREKYTHGEGRCAPAGKVIIRCQGEEMRYSWIGWEKVDTLLHRPEGGAPSTSGSASSSSQSPPVPSPPAKTGGCGSGCSTSNARSPSAPGLFLAAALVLARRRRARRTGRGIDPAPREVRSCHLAA